LPFAKAWNELYYYLLIFLMLVYIPGKKHEDAVSIKNVADQLTSIFI
jgi:hypothetical protein